MSRAAVSLATTQPRSSRPSTSGRMPCGSRAAYSVPSSIQTKREGALELGQQLDGALLERAVGVEREQRGDQRGVVGAGLELAGAEVELGVGWAGRRPSAARSRVLVRLPLWASAIEPSAVGRKVGWALCQVLAPVVE